MKIHVGNSQAYQPTENIRRILMESPFLVRPKLVDDMMSYITINRDQALAKGNHGGVKPPLLTAKDHPFPYWWKDDSPASKSAPQLR